MSSWNSYVEALIFSPSKYDFIGRQSFYADN